ncbi:hypothetical protein [Dactylosporangium sp. CA-139066]|uniref:hypothetical protein n=1 Tax=Dactylosporangium sp. CA-139066 TaxID=3239930 RepID=UPI003D8A9CD8
MVNKLRAVGDRMLGALLPKATARAYNCWDAYDSNCRNGAETCCWYEGQGTRCWCTYGPA